MSNLKHVYIAAGAIFIAAALWYSVIVIFYYFPVGYKVSHNINKEKILSLRIGMDNKQVMDILGDPIYIEDIVSGKNMVYATPGLLGAGVEINIKIINNLLYGIYIEEADLGIYYCDENKCIGITNAAKFDNLFEAR